MPLLLEAGASCTLNSPNLMTGFAHCRQGRRRGNRAYPKDQLCPEVCFSQ
jgi:hypothetical protein